MTAKNTVHLHRVLTAKPEKIYRAFLDPDAMARWLPPNGFTGKADHLINPGAICTKDAYRGESVKAVVVLRATHKATTEQDIIDWCRDTMAVYKVPRVVPTPSRCSERAIWNCASASNGFSRRFHRRLAFRGLV